jgi:hypothetical protein
MSKNNEHPPRNGYSVKITPLPQKRDVCFVTLVDEMKNIHCFSLIRLDGRWMIRNPSTVPKFIVEMEEEIIKYI